LGRRRVAFVVQRYGTEITGGSEAHCREIAERMSRNYDVEVLTTCATDHLSWKNALPEGVSQVNGVRVRRFPTREERHLLNFHRIYDRIFTSELTPEEEQQLLRYQGPYCPDLIDYLKRHSSDYDAFVFFTYMYYTTIYGLPLVKDKAIFVPTAHDEASLYIRLLDDVFHQTPRIMFNTDEERYLLQRRFNLPSEVGRIVGMGIDVPEAGAADPYWEKLNATLAGMKVLTYVGRVENGKGCDELVDHFTRFVGEQKRADLLLLLLGKRTLPLAPHPQILSPGFVSEYVKFHALASTHIAIAPSPFESLCIAALESWMHRRPLLVNGQCPVLVGHCIRSNGGLWYSSYSEFRECLNKLLGEEELRIALGENGREYVERNYRWPVVEQAYIEELESVFAANKDSTARGTHGLKQT
jgi:glycosyltransferase involved in cell wall biosynthesis